eukprot:6252497-Alexandrium_andersonii.AAC.1
MEWPGALPRRVGGATVAPSGTAAAGGSDSERWPKGPRAGGEKEERRGKAGAGRAGRAPAVPCGKRAQRPAPSRGRSQMVARPERRPKAAASCAS